MSIDKLQFLFDKLKIRGKIISCDNNGICSKYRVVLDPSARADKIEKCSSEIALHLKAQSKPIIKILPSEGVIEIECLMNSNNSVGLDYFLQKPSDAELPLYLGRSYDGNDIVEDLTLLPHLLVAGTTGSGKSCLLHSIICGLIKSRPELSLILIDPKQVEFRSYEKIKQLAAPIINKPLDALDAMSELIDEMEDRYELIRKSRTKNIREYNKYNRPLRYQVMIIDEFADLINENKKQFQDKLTTISQKSRSCGIHMILATQRPSVSVITGAVKANFPSRISCKVASGSDSRVVLDCNGAEKLLGKGDSLIKSDRFDLVRFKATFMSDEDITKIVKPNLVGFWGDLLNRLNILDS